MLIDRVHDHGTAPDALYVLDHFLASLEIEAAAVGPWSCSSSSVPSMRTCLAATVGAPKLYFGLRGALSCSALRSLSRLSPAVGCALEAEQLELVGELLGQMIADEAEVVVLLHGCARAASSPCSSTIASQIEKPRWYGLIAERDLLVGGERAHDVRVALDRIDDRPAAA